MWAGESRLSYFRSYSTNFPTMNLHFRPLIGLGNAALITLAFLWYFSTPPYSHLRPEPAQFLPRGSQGSMDAAVSSCCVRKHLYPPSGFRVCHPWPVQNQVGCWGSCFRQGSVERARLCPTCCWLWSHSCVLTSHHPRDLLDAKSPNPLAARKQPWYRWQTQWKF